MLFSSQSLPPPALGEGDAIVALNAALMQDGVVIEIAAGAELADPIEIVYATVAKNAGGAVFPFGLSWWAKAPKSAWPSGVSARVDAPAKPFGLVRFSISPTTPMSPTARPDDQDRSSGSLRLDTSHRQSRRQRDPSTVSL